MLLKVSDSLLLHLIQMGFYAAIALPASYRATDSVLHLRCGSDFTVNSPSEKPRAVGRLIFLHSRHMKTRLMAHKLSRISAHDFD